MRIRSMPDVFAGVRQKIGPHQCIAENTLITLILFDFLKTLGAELILFPAVTRKKVGGCSLQIPSLIDVAKLCSKCVMSTEPNAVGIGFAVNLEDHMGCRFPSQSVRSHGHAVLAAMWLEKIDFLTRSPAHAFCIKQGGQAVIKQFYQLTSAYSCVARPPFPKTVGLGGAKAKCHSARLQNAGRHTERPPPRAT